MLGSEAPKRSHGRMRDSTAARTTPLLLAVPPLGFVGRPLGRSTPSRPSGLAPAPRPPQVVLERSQTRLTWEQAFTYARQRGGRLLTRGADEAATIFALSGGARAASASRRVASARMKPSRSDEIPTRSR